MCDRDGDFQQMAIVQHPSYRLTRAAAPFLPLFVHYITSIQGKETQVPLAKHALPLLRTRGPG